MWDYDVWFQLACGRAIWTLRGLPPHDLFSFTAADHAWDTQEWLSQVVGFGLWNLGGLTLLTVAKAALAAGLVAHLAAEGAGERGPTARWIALGVCASGAYVLRWHLVERPQVLSMALMALELAGLRRGLTWPVVPLTLAWANLHGGSALLGPGLLGLWLACESATTRRAPARPALLAFAGSLAAVACNPAGWHLFTYPFTTLRDPMYMANILEWTPPRFWEQPAAFVWLAGAAAAAVVGRTSWRLPDLLAGALMTGLALSARRHLPLAVIVLIPPVIRGLAALGRPERAQRAEGLADRTATLAGRWHEAARWIPGASLAAAAVAIAVAAGRGEALRLGVRTDLYPAAATTALSAMGSAFPRRGNVRVFTLHRWGGYCIWHLPERFKVFIDGRQLVYGPALFADYCRILTDVDHTGALLRRYSPDILIVEHAGGLTERLAASRQHALIYWDDTCRIYGRRGSLKASWLSQHAYRAALPEPRPRAKPDAVLAETQRAAREAPDDARPWLIRAEYLLALGRMDEAWHSAQAAVLRRPTTVPVLLTACRIALARNDPTIAAGLARRAEAADPGGTAPQLAFARIALATQQPDEAGRRILLALEHGRVNERRLQRPEPGLTDAWQFRAELAGAAKDHPLAAESWREAGNRWYREARYDEALRCYDAGLAEAPADPKLLHNRAAALGGLGRRREARAAWQRVLRANPLDDEARKFLGGNHLR